MATIPTNYVYGTDTYSPAKVDGRKHSRTCAHCGHTVQRSVTEYISGRKVLHIACVMQECPDRTRANGCDGCASCRRPLGADDGIMAWGKRYCNSSCVITHRTAVRGGECA